MELEFDPDRDYEVLEELAFDELGQRDLEHRFYTLSQQADDWIRLAVPEGRVFRMQLQQARQEALLATGLLQKAVAYSVSELPKPQRVSKDPLPGFLPWMIPVVEGRDLIRDTDLPSNDTMLVVDSQDDRAPPKTYAQALVNWLDKCKVVVPSLAASPEDALTPPQRTRVTYDGVKIVKREAKSQRKETILLPAFQFWQGSPLQNGRVKLEPVELYPAERLPIRGWTLLPFEQGAEDAIVDPPSTQLWFQKAPVVLTSYRDIFALRPSLAEVLQNRPQDPARLHDYLAYWGLDVRDIDHETWRHNFPDAPVPIDNGPVEALKTVARDSIDILVSGYTVHFSALNPYRWLSGQADGGLTARLEKLLKSLDRMARTTSRIPPPIRMPEDLATMTPEACTELLVKSYGDFVRTGIYRVASQQCIPVAVAQREQELRFLGGRASKSAAMQLLNTRIEALKQFLTRAAERQPDAGFAAARRTEEAPASVEQLLVYSILKDASLSEDARLRKLEDILQNLPSTQLGELHFYDGNFLLCEHTLDWLRNASTDHTAVWDRWAIEVDGKYCCQYCGEDMGQVIAEDAYDETLDTSGPAAPAAPALADETDALRELLAGSPEGALLLQFILSLGLQPDMAWLKDFYSFVLRVNDSVAGSRPAMREVLAVAWMVFAFKMHGMRPRRSLARVPFTLAGFPRSAGDTDTADAPLVDFVIGCLATIARMDPRNRTRNARNPLYKAVLDSPKNFREKLLAVMLRLGREIPPETVFINEDQAGASALEPAELPRSLQLPGVARLGFPYAKSVGRPRVPRQMKQHVVHEVEDEPAPPRKPRLDKRLADMRKPSLAIRLQRPDLPSKDVELLEYKATVGTLLAVVRAGLGRGAYGWSGSQLQGNSDVVSLTMKLNETVAQLPALESIGLYRLELENLVRLAVAAETRDDRYDIATHCLQNAIDILQGVFGKTATANLLKSSMEAQLGIYAYTDAQVRERVQRAKALERRTVDQRFGSLSDAQRELDKSLRDMGLLPRSIVDEGDRAEIAALVDTEAVEPVLGLATYSEDDYLNEDYVDNVDYEDMQESHEAYDD